VANPGLGYRNVNSVLVEISNHLVEPIVNTNFTGSQLPPGINIVPVNSTVGIYVGALLIIDAGRSNQEIVTVTAVNPGVSFTTSFVNAHNPGPILTATFPTQQPTDPFFTQSEMLGYLARAQNEFLAKIPCIFQFFQQMALAGTIFQSTPPACVEIDRVAVSVPAVAIQSLTRVGTVVLAVSYSPHGFQNGTKFNLLNSTSNPLSNPSFVGAFTVSEVVDPHTFKYVHVVPDATATGGTAGTWSRLYEVSQEELVLQDRNWMVSFILNPVSWFEDRAGNYRWGLGGRLTANFPVELLCSVRDSDTLSLTDGFLVPDPLLHYIKYKALEYVWSKDGVQFNPQMATYCQQRFDMGVIAVERWLDGVTAVAGTSGRRASVSRR
jgi:hypothetical protein